MVTPDGARMPRPRGCRHTRAGCDVGAVATANIVLENTGTGPTATSPRCSVIRRRSHRGARRPARPSGTAARAKAQTDFVGLAIHCAQGSALCARATTMCCRTSRRLHRLQGTVRRAGDRSAADRAAGDRPLTDLLGNPIVDPFGQPGFPGFDGMSAAVSLAYVAAMQEQGIPGDLCVHLGRARLPRCRRKPHVAFGPGDAGYVQQLKAYDDAFAAFFARLAADGIDKSNTLFVFTVDEGDHFVGVQKTNCDGVTTPCVYGANEVGEINANIDTLVTQFPSLAAQFLGTGAPNAFTVHGDDAPPFYLAKKGVGPLAQTDPLTREFERDIANLTAVNPYTGATDHLMVRMADQTEMKALHMFTTGDPARNATFVLFADPNYFLTDFPASTCETCINPAFAWNHGDIQPEIANTWLGFVGPGVRRKGVSGRLDRPHRRAADDAVARGARGSVRARRARAGRDPERFRPCRRPCGPTAPRCSSWAASTSSSTRPSVSSRRICWLPRPVR